MESNLKELLDEITIQNRFKIDKDTFLSVLRNEFKNKEFDEDQDYWFLLLFKNLISEIVVSLLYDPEELEINQNRITMKTEENINEFSFFTIGLFFFYQSKDKELIEYTNKKILDILKFIIKDQDYWFINDVLKIDNNFDKFKDFLIKKSFLTSNERPLIH